MTDEIVVFAEPEVEDLGGAWIARLPAMKLRGRSSKTQVGALANLYADFPALVCSLRLAGVLEDWLRDSGVTWGYVRDFPDVKSRFRG